MKIVLEVFIRAEIGRDARQMRANTKEMERIVTAAVEKLTGAVVVSVDMNTVEGVNDE